MHRPKRVRFVVSDTLDTCVNLAYEEHFMNTVAEDEWIVFWWQSENSVVIGRNQNPYQECNLEKMKANGVRLVRRLSGGGAVYHDTGNLNFAFIAKGELYDIEMHFEVLLAGLSELGVEGVFTGRNDLCVNGRKFSGNAFIHDEDKHLHHGTLLMDSDVTRIANYLNVGHDKLDTKGFDSVKSRVINLVEVAPDISADRIMDAVEKAIKDILSCEILRCEIADFESSSTRVYLDKYYSDLWNYGDTPSFSCEMKHRFDWGGLHISMDIQEGVIHRTAITTDALEAEAFFKLEDKLQNVMLIPDAIHESIKSTGLGSDRVQDVYALISKRLFA